MFWLEVLFIQTTLTVATKSVNNTVDLRGYLFLPIQTTNDIYWYFIQSKWFYKKAFHSLIIFNIYKLNHILFSILNFNFMVM